MNSAFLKLNWRDFAKGAFMAVLAAVITPILAAANTGDFGALTTLDWAEIGKTAFTVFLAYIGKQLFTDVNGKLGGKI